MPKKKEKKSGVSSWFSWGRSTKPADSSDDKHIVQTSMSDSEIGSSKMVSKMSRTLASDSEITRVCHGGDRIIVGFTTTFAISAYQH
jgi:hypothetical protein